MLLDDDLKRVLVSKISSVEELDILALFKQNPDRELSVQEINQEIRSTEHSVKLRLASLCSHDLVSKSQADGATRYKLNAGDAAKELRERLLKAYAECRVQVIEAIYAGPKRNIEEFAAAFQWRRKDGEGS